MYSKNVSTSPYYEYKYINLDVCCSLLFSFFLSLSLTIFSFLCWNQRMDLGECPKVHDLALRADYEKAAKHKDYYYDIDVSRNAHQRLLNNPLHFTWLEIKTNFLSFFLLQAMEHLQAFIADCDRRTEAAKKRLAETQEELTAEVAVKANAVHQLAEEIGKKLAKAEALGEAGEVEESVQLMAEIDELRAKKVQAEQEYRSSMPASSYQQQKLRVCEVCSAYLGIHDNDIRLADHFGGKLHLGFMAIREKLAELEVSIALLGQTDSHWTDSNALEFTENSRPTEKRDEAIGTKWTRLRGELQVR